MKSSCIGQPAVLPSAFRCNVNGLPSVGIVMALNVNVAVSLLISGVPVRGIADASLSPSHNCGVASPILMNCTAPRKVYCSALQSTSACWSSRRIDNNCGLCGSTKCAVSCTLQSVASGNEMLITSYSSRGLAREMPSIRIVFSPSDAAGNSPVCPLHVATTRLLCPFVTLNVTTAE